MKLTVLGVYAPYAPPGGATSGYILSGGKTNILLDCGSGVISRMQEFMEPDDIDAVFLSHLHGDHAADVAVLRYMYGFRKQFGIGESDGVTVYTPDNPELEYAYVKSVRFFDVRPVSHGLEAQVGDMKLKFFKMEHPYPVFGVRAQCEDKVFAYSGDTVMNDNIAPMINGADVFLCDASFLEADKQPDSSHLSAAEAARLSRDNGVKRLILTHRLTHYRGYTRHLVEARAVFKNAQLAEETETYEF